MHTRIELGSTTRVSFRSQKLAMIITNGTSYSQIQLKDQSNDWLQISTQHGNETCTGGGQQGALLSNC